MTKLKLSRRQFLKSAVLVGGGTLLSACAPAPAPPAAAPTEVATPTVVKPAEAKTLRVYYGPKLEWVDPHTHVRTWHESMMRNCYECLVQMSKDLESIEPQLAVSWERIDDLTMQFKLREGVKFHNGEDFDAEAVKFSIDRVLDPETGAPVRDTYPLKSPEVVDKYTINIITERPTPHLLRLMSGFHTTIVPPKFATEKGLEGMATEASGTGPYRIVDYTPAEEVVFEANEAYWGGGPEVKRVVINFAGEASTRVAALLAGEIDVTHALPPIDIPRIEDNPSALVRTVPGNRIVHYTLGQKHPELQKPKVRLAMNYASNMDGIIESVLEGHGYRRATMLNPWHFGYHPDLEPHPYDMDRAKALIDEADVADPNIPMVITEGRVPLDKEVGEALAGQLEQLGFNVNLQVIEIGSYYTRGNAEEFVGNLCFQSWGNWVHDAHISLHTLYHSEQWFNNTWIGGYKNAEFDQLVEQAAVELDPERREQLYYQAQEVIYEDPPAIFAYAIEDIYGLSDRIVWEPRSDEMIWFKEMSWA